MSIWFRPDKLNQYILDMAISFTIQFRPDYQLDLVINIFYIYLLNLPSMSLSFESLKLDKNVEIEECRCYHKESDIEGIRG